LCRGNEIEKIEERKERNCEPNVKRVRRRKGVIRGLSRARQEESQLGLPGVAFKMASIH